MATSPSSPEPSGPIPSADDVRLREALGGSRVPVWWSYDVVVGIR